MIKKIQHYFNQLQQKKEKTLIEPYLKVIEDTKIKYIKVNYEPSHIQALIMDNKKCGYPYWPRTKDLAELPKDSSNFMMYLLLQVNLEDLPKSHPFPFSEGVVQIFVDKYLTETKVLHHEKVEDFYTEEEFEDIGCHSHCRSKDAESTGLNSVQKISFEEKEEYCIPDSDAGEYCYQEIYALPEYQKNKILKIIDEKYIDDDKHTRSQIGGYAYSCQGSSLQESNIYQKWITLFQYSSDSQHNIEIGDGGTCSIVIRQTDLEKLKLDRTEIVTECF